MCATVAMGITINKFWEIFSYGVNRYHNEKLIGIREFPEILDLGFLDNTFTTDTWNPLKNTST